MTNYLISSDKQLVEFRSGKPVTTSLLVSEKFAKRHDRVLEAIRSLIASLPYSSAPIFRESKYTNERGKALPMFEMNRDGFSLLAMGFTGKKALRFKLEFIAAFNYMEQALLNRQNLSWREARQEGKVVRRELTDAVCEFVDYATAQGSLNASLYYQNITRLTYKALFFVKEASPKPFRDMLDTMQVVFLATAEYVARQSLLDGMKQGLPYKEVYALARDRVTAYAATLPNQRLLAA